MRNGVLLTSRRLTTAEILYHRPDHPALLQSFVWQDYDLVPDFPGLAKFLRFWRKEIEGKLHSVWVAAAGLTPVRVNFADELFNLN